MQDCIGRGAHGAVYRAEDRVTGEVVAVKQVKLVDLNDAELREITSEIELLRCLDHPNIVRCKGSEELDKHLHIVLEYCGNGSLRDVLKRFGKVPETLAAVYLRQVVEGLAYLHQQGIIHRDIKAANILTMHDGSVKLADFGSAVKAGVEKDAKEAAVDAVGSPYWMAPEVIEQKQLTTSSDIWSVGCLLIELLTGKPPYADLEPLSALFRVVDRGRPPDPVGCSSGVREVLKSCFHRDPEKRCAAIELLHRRWLFKAQADDRKSAAGDIDRLVPRETPEERIRKWTAAVTPTRRLPLEQSEANRASSRSTSTEDTCSVRSTVSAEGRSTRSSLTTMSRNLPSVNVRPDSSSHRRNLKRLAVVDSHAADACRGTGQTPIAKRTRAHLNSTHAVSHYRAKLPMLDSRQTTAAQNRNEQNASPM